MTAGRSNKTCYCKSYPYPHRFLSGKCGDWEHVILAWDTDHSACQACAFRSSSWDPDLQRSMSECTLIESKKGRFKPTDCPVLEEPQPKE